MIEFIIIIFSAILFFFYKNLSNFFNLFDKPDGFRKLHKLPIPLIGGPIIFIVFLLFLIVTQFNQFVNFEVNDLKFEQIKFLIIGSCLFFILGFFDDKFNINANIKFLLFLLILLILFLSDKNLVINKINFSFADNIFFLDKFSLPWTIICFLLFINAINMFDGINLQSGSFIFLCLIYLTIFTSLADGLIFALIVPVSIFLFLNFKSKLFLGNSGTYFFGFLLGALFVLSYNLEKIFYVDEIVLIMLIPGLDLMRLFFTRISKGKHPFSPDRNHLHHILNDNFKNNETFLIILLLMWTPVLISKIFETYFILIILKTLIYSILVFKFKKISN